MTGRMSLLHRARVIGAGLAALMGLALTTPAQAEEFRYSYVGDVFDVETFLIRADPGNNLIVAPDRIRADIWTSELLTAGATQNDVLRFSLSLVPAAGGVGETLTFPGPSDPCCGGSVETTASFSIGATGMFALPTVWNLSINQTRYLPTGRFDQLSLSTTQSRDAMTGEAETYNTRVGSMVGSPGVWVLAVVPEPSRSAQWLGGLALLGVIGAVGRRSRS